MAQHRRHYQRDPVTAKSQLMTATCRPVPNFPSTHHVGPHLEIELGARGV